MRITVLSLRGPTNKNVKGGAREYIKQLVVPWVEAGHHVKLICGQEKEFNLPNHENVEGIEVIRVGKTGTLVFSIWKKFINECKSNTDLVIENMVSFPLLTPIFTRKMKRSTIIHHLTGKEYFKTHNVLIALIGYFLEKVILRLVYKKTKVITVSDLTKNNLVENGIPENNIEIIEPGIDTSFFVKSEKSESPLIVYVGRYDGENGVKKVNELILAFNKVFKKHPNSKLIIAGPNKGVEELKKIDKTSAVEFIGFINEEKKRELLQRAWVFASPSLKEGFGITFVEANACGTPVVGYEIKGLKTVADGAGFFVESQNVNQLSEKIIDILADPKLREQMENNAVANAERFSWKIFKSKSCRYLNNMI